MSHANAVGVGAKGAGRDFGFSRRLALALMAAAVFAVIGVGAPSGASADPLTLTFDAIAEDLGSIPEPATFNCGNFTANPRVVRIPVAGMPAHITDVSLSLSFIHAWSGDVDVRLIAPGGQASHVIFSRTGAVTVNGCGDNTRLAGPYVFSDHADSQPNGGWWQAAAALGTGVSIPAGTYRTTEPGGAGAVSPAPPTLMTPAFVPIGDPNGDWTLEIRDGVQGDQGWISAASLTITALDPLKFGTVTTNKKKGTGTAGFVVEGGGGTIVLYGNGINTVYRSVRGAGDYTLAIKPNGALKKKLKKKGKAAVTVKAVFAPAWDAPAIAISKKVTLKAKKAKKKKKKK